MKDFMATASSSNRLVGISVDTFTKLFEEISIHSNLPKLKLKESIGIHSIE
jgi:hypothetical protein